MKNVLFVCRHNTGRSQMAQAFLNHMASERGLLIHADSAGTVAQGEISPVVREAMREVGISLDGQQPKQLMCWHSDHADLVITMHCGAHVDGCQARVGHVEDWDLEDPTGLPLESVRRIRDAIQANVENLLIDMTGEMLIGAPAPTTQ